MLEVECVISTKSNQKSFPEALEVDGNAIDKVFVPVDVVGNPYALEPTDSPAPALTAIVFPVF